MLCVACASITVCGSMETTITSASTIPYIFLLVIFYLNAKKGSVRFSSSYKYSKFFRVVVE